MRKIGLETEYTHCNNSFDPELDDGSARAKALFNSPNHCPVKYVDNLFSIGDKLTYQDGDHCKLDRGFFDSGSYSLEYVSAPVGLDLAFMTLVRSDERVERLSQGTGIRLFRSSLDYWSGCDIPSLLGTHYNFDAPVIMLVEGHDYHRPGPTGYPVLFGANRLLLDQLIALVGYVAGSGYYCRLRNEVVPRERLYGMSLQRADKLRYFRWRRAQAAGERVGAMGAKRINLSHIETITHQLAVATMNWDEPIPPYRTRYPNVLESCVNTPFQTHNRKDLYPNLHAKVAILFYLLIKNHPFQNGNKRIAVTTTLVFLFLNNEWMTIQPQKLCNLAIWVAQSDPDVRDAVIAGLNDLIDRYSRAVK